MFPLGISFIVEETWAGSLTALRVRMETGRGPLLKSIFRVSPFRACEKSQRLAALSG